MCIIFTSVTQIVTAVFQKSFSLLLSASNCLFLGKDREPYGKRHKECD